MKLLARVSPPAIAFAVALLVVLAAAAHVHVPAPRLLLMITVVWASVRGGMPSGMVSTAFAVAAMVVSASLTGSISANAAADDVAYTFGFILVSYIVGGLRHRLDELRELQQELHQVAIVNDDKLTRVLESITDGFITLDASWHVTYVNHRGELMLGRARHAMLGRYILDVFPEGVGSVIHRELDRARRSTQPVEFEALYATANRWFEVRAFPATDGSLTVYFRDVTRRKRAQQAVSLQARMLDAVRQAVIAVEPDGVIFYWNHAAEELFGWRAEQVIGRTTLVVTHVDIGPEESENLLRRLHDGESWGDELPLRRRDGSTFSARVDDAPILDEGGVVLGMVRVVTDLTERKEAHQAQEFLAQAGSDLAATLDFDALTTAIALLAVPSLGECCILDLNDETSSARRIESAWDVSLCGSGPHRFSQRVHHGEGRATLLLQDGQAALITRITDAVLRSLTALPDELDRLRRSGVRSVVVAPLTAGGRLLGTLTVISTKRVYTSTDAALVTEFARRVALAADNALLYETARVASKAKSDFLAVMSHELRTPLTTVMGYTDLLLAEVSGALPTQSRNYVERIRLAAWHLLGLIEQILIYTRVEVGREKVNVERVPVEYVLRDAAALMEPFAAEKGLEFRLVPPSESAIIDTDLTKLRQILLNLLSNAVKFTDRGSVTLEAQIDAQHIEFVVQDTGIGIATEHLEAVFESFWQADQSATRRVGGTGLGLSVARSLARLMDGDISVQSALGAGTTFRLRLPKSVRAESPAPVLA